MIRLGHKAKLEIVKKTDFGYYLDGQNMGEILLPKRYMTAEMAVGKAIDVFVFLDGEERIVATTKFHDIPHPILSFPVGEVRAGLTN